MADVIKTATRDAYGKALVELGGINDKVVVLDACYNGAFCHDAYMAEEYIFEGGDCVVTIANSVNSLQDKWCDRNLGMFGLGLRVGNFVKYNPYFESHIFGDPTFAFAPFTNIGFDVNDAIYKSNKWWKKQLSTKFCYKRVGSTRSYIFG